MEAAAVLGARPSVSSSYLHSQNSEALQLIRRLQKPTLRSDHRRLAAFHSPSNLFSYSPFRPLCSQHQTPHLPSHLVASMEQVEETYIMVKTRRRSNGASFEKKGFKLTGLKLFQCPNNWLRSIIRISRKSHSSELIEYITSGPVVCMFFSRHHHDFTFARLGEGVGVVASARKLIGSTNPLQAEQAQSEETLQFKQEGMWFTGVIALRMENVKYVRPFVL
ncbi:Nucleoside diphosphate kinase 2, chloroplastic [Vitis vinifera]|uniref:nucleoside-diphosphate kinase n=1 Tax=Vitis vinifera TaxID=29760 RepID=A0A438CXJ0_VITVI|nr:Nucleoside diphosphate kinase 2, chloroplastic [Vitis vinifera]